jgi:enoyl-[acyl-carrier protein] reductase I
MQNLFHDGGFSNTGVTQGVIERFGEEEEKIVYIINKP